MQTTINQHGEKVTVIGSVRDVNGRTDITIVEFVSCGRPCFSLKGRGGGHPDKLRFSTLVKLAKKIYADPSNQAEWLI